MTPTSTITNDDVLEIMDRHREADEVSSHVDEPLDFWHQRESLTHVLEFARARRAGPWAVLGVTLARAIAATEPTVMLPPTIGGPVSLNLFVALVGPSGGGKGAAEGAARAAVQFTDHAGIDVDAESFTLGSGEGLARTFRPHGQGDDEDERRTRALFTVAEVDTLTALGGRTGATLLPELRKLYSGETIGFQNAGKHTRVVIPEHEYRACLTVGVQPAKAGALIHDADGGTPQRFLWLPVDDPDAPDVKPSDPPALVVKAPRWGAERVQLEVPDSARREIDAQRLAVLRGETVDGKSVDPLDGHRMLTRLKVSAALAILDGRSIVTVDDWFLGGVIMAKSDRTRMRIEATLAEQTRRANRARAEIDGERSEIADDVKATAERRRVEEAIVRHLSRKGQMPRSKLHSAVRANIRQYLQEALDALAESGTIRELRIDGREHYTLV